MKDSGLIFLPEIGTIKYWDLLQYEAFMCIVIIY